MQTACMPSHMRRFVAQKNLSQVFANTAPLYSMPNTEYYLRQLFLHVKLLFHCLDLYTDSSTCPSPACEMIALAVSSPDSTGAQRCAAITDVTGATAGSHTPRYLHHPDTDLRQHSQVLILIDLPYRNVHMRVLMRVLK